MKCECGGELRRVVLDEYDFSAEAGLPVKLREVPALRCARCDEVVLEGAVAELGLHLVGLALVKQKELLRPEQAKYLRKLLGATQKELADRMSIARETVAAWECGQKTISPQHDYILRSLAVGNFMEELRAAVIAERAQIAAALGGVRSKEPSKRRTTLVVDHVRTQLEEQHAA